LKSTQKKGNIIVEVDFMTKRFLIILLGSLLIVAAASLWFFYQPLEIATNSNEIIEPLSLPKIKNINLAPEAIANPKVSLWIAGDIMLDRNVHKKTQTVGEEDYNFPFALLSTTTQQYDFRIANLEGPVTDNRSIVSPSNLSFTFSPNYLESLKNNFEIVNLGNNHTNNFGRDGLKQTREYLDQTGIKYFGDPYNTSSSLSLVIEKNDIKIDLIGFNQLAGAGFDKVLTEIKNLRPQVDYLIALPHWGIEYNNVNPGQVQKTQARQIVDAGADIIIAGHPHVIQPIEKYNDKLIFYSLGNFIFDQYFSPETMRGLTISLNLEKASDKIISTLELLPIKLNLDYQPYFVQNQDKQDILDFIANNSWVDENIKEQIKLGIIKF
jgi:poly-gamma-glutamate synthesis protein (capsule biosynthesis protein)